MSWREIGLMSIRCSSTVIFFTTIWLVSLIQEILTCSVTPSEHAAIAGGKVSFSCNARPNNERQGTVSKWTLENGGTSGALIYQPPVYGPNSKVNVEQSVADGYFLSYADEDLINITIQINETQLKHGGKYYCTCAGSNSSLGTLNLVVLEPNPKLVLNKEKPLIPGEMVDLDCSVSVSGSTPLASVDLTILNATGELLANRSNLQLMKDSTTHHLEYRFLADQIQEQNFTCEMQVWTKSSDRQRLLYSSSSSLYFNSGRGSTIRYETTTVHTSKSASIITFAVIGAIVIFIPVLLIFVCIRQRGRCHETKTVNTRRAVLHNYGQPRKAETAEGGRKITCAENNGFLVEEDEDPQKCKVDNELVVFDNLVYDATPRFTETRKTCFLNILHQPRYKHRDLPML